jgi:hypothetical protein
VHTSDWDVAVRPRTGPGNTAEPADDFEMADTGNALEKSTDGVTRGGWTGCNARIAALEMQSVVPQANSPVG